MKTYITNVENIAIEGINYRDYPDFVDAYISYATWKSTKLQLTDDELQELTENSYDYIQQRCVESASSRYEYNKGD